MEAIFTQHECCCAENTDWSQFEDDTNNFESGVTEHIDKIHHRFRLFTHGEECISKQQGNQKHLQHDAAGKGIHYRFRNDAQDEIRCSGRSMRCTYCG